MTRGLHKPEKPSKAQLKKTEIENVIEDDPRELQEQGVIRDDPKSRKKTIREKLKETDNLEEDDPGEF